MSQALADVATHLILEAETASDLMDSNLVSLRDKATVREAIALLTGKRYHAVPVINEAGQAVGVVSRADILVHEREQLNITASEASLRDPMLVRDIMTPAIFSVKTDTPAATVIASMTAMNVHQLFVMDDDGVVLGIISAFDIIRRLRQADGR